MDNSGLITKVDSQKEIDVMTRYLDPTNDVAFRKLFSEKHRLMSFLNAVLDLKTGHKVKELQFLPKDQAPLIKEAKSIIFDVKCTDEEGKQYIVEMQNKKIPAFVKRAQLYASHSYVTQMSSGEDYSVLKPVILLCIANHVLFPNKDQIISYHQTLDRHTSEHDLQELSYVFIELPKFHKEEETLLTLQDQWLYFFKNWAHSQEIPSIIQERELIDAYRSMEQFNWTKQELDSYFQAQIALADDFLGRQAERAEGLAQGLAQGRAEGLAEGEVKGRTSAFFEIAKRMLTKGNSSKEIMETTGLSLQEIKRLQSYSDANPG